MDYYCSVLEHSCVTVSSGVAPIGELATSISWLSSSVSGDTSHFGLEVMELASLSNTQQEEELFSGAPSQFDSDVVERARLVNRVPRVWRSSVARI